jgi:hypothetical protein
MRESHEGPFVGIPIRPPAVEQAARYELHRRAVIPALTMQQMADILFDPRGVCSVEQAKMSGRQAMQMKEPLRAALESGKLSADDQVEILDRGRAVHEAMSLAPETVNMEPDFYGMLEDALAQSKRAANPVFYMSAKVKGMIAGIRKRHRRTKRRARYNRGKMGVRPRMRSGGR